MTMWLGRKKSAGEENPNQSVNSRKIKWLSKKTVLLGILLTLVITGLFFGWGFFHGPATGTIQTVNSQTKDKTAIIAASVVSLKTKYFSLDYPSRYQLEQNTSKASGTTAYWVLNAHGQLDSGISRIGITLEPLPDGGISSVSAYQRYMLNKGTYKLSQEKFGLTTATVATKYNSADYEQTAFITNGNQLLIIASSSVTGSTDSLAMEFHAIMSSLKWQ